jgi:hypothetical protein
MNYSGQLEILKKRRPLERTPPELVDKIVKLFDDGKPIIEIATATGVDKRTVRKWLRKRGWGGPTKINTRDKALHMLRHSFDDLMLRSLDQTNKIPDRRICKEILAECGIFAETQPKADPVEGGRIVIEWSGPPPPWAPKDILAEQAKLALPVEAKDESKTGPSSL